ncbi:hypothetical protein DPX16_14648 [Anabarilius grahami]|uniref:Uncharacterized protein n=1 Tax=Anabarilius grahami TaxID=495550 RepID=A0A3N0XNU2_ANAGA|nr:hypothetical protein DPX16_14648 [Anabarilius grahami]
MHKRCRTSHSLKAARQQDGYLGFRTQPKTTKRKASASASSELVQLASLLRTGLPFHGLENQHRARSYVTVYVSYFTAKLVPQRQTQIHQARLRCIGFSHSDGRMTSKLRENDPKAQGVVCSTNAPADPRHPPNQSALLRCISNKPSINNRGCFNTVDAHGFANLHRHPNTARRNLYIDGDYK